MLIDFLAGCLATWAIASLLYFEFGPADVFLKLRNYAALRSPFWDAQFTCFWCCTRIGAVVAFVLYLIAPILLYPLAFSGAAILLTHGGRIIQKEMQDNG